MCLAVFASVILPVLTHFVVTTVACCSLQLQDTASAYNDIGLTYTPVHPVLCTVAAGESQACAAAAKERIEVLEQEAEQAATEQQAAAEAAAQALETAKADAAKELQAAQAAAATQLQQVQEQQEGDMKKLKAELEAVQVRVGVGKGTYRWCGSARHSVVSGSVCDCTAAVKGV